MNSSRHFANWLKAYAEHTSKSEAPAEFHFWTGVATIAGALRRQVWIDQRYFQWTPNFYIVLVGPPGVVTKSTSMRTGLKLLRRLDTVRMGPQSMTWQGLTLALEEAQQLVPTGEKDGEKLYTPMSAITCDVSELGTFLRTDDPRMVDVLVDLWDGQEVVWEHKLRTREASKLVNPWINIIACTTPTWLKQNVPEHMIGGGLISRIIFVFGDKKRHLIPYPGDVIPGPEHKETEDKLAEDLKIIGSMTGEIKLTDEAKAWGAAWYEDHWTRRPDHLLSERYEGYLGRKQTHMHKLAIVLSAAEREGNMQITEKHLITAADILQGAEHNMVKVFESIGMAESTDKINTIVDTVRIYKVIEKRPLWRICMRSMSFREFEESISAAANAELISITNDSQQGVLYRIKKLPAKAKEGAE